MNNEVDNALLLSKTAKERHLTWRKREAEKNTTRNPETNYGLEIAETLNRFTSQQKALAKFKIQQVLLEIEFPSEMYATTTIKHWF